MRLHNFSDYFFLLFSEVMNLISIRLRKLLNQWPGKNIFGIYRFLPAFFVLGAALEFSMINWTVGETNFCKSIFLFLYIFAYFLQ